MLKKFYFALNLFALLIGSAPYQAKAQQGPYSSVNLGGVPIHCIGGGGQQVAIFIDPSVDQNIGRAFNNGYPIVVLGPGFFNSVPPAVAQFWFLHECAHHVVGSNEAVSDCFAIRNLRNLGLLHSQYDVQQLLSQIYNMPGSYTHLPGPARAANILSCYLS